MSIARQVLFLCTGNSCRSQMAEGIVNSGRAGDWAAFSAGSRPAGFVHPLAIRMLAAFRSARDELLRDLPGLLEREAGSGP